MAIGGEALDLFEVSFSASDMALSEATAAKANNPFGGFYNPATLPLQRQVSLYSSQGKLTDQVDVFSLTTLFCVQVVNRYSLMSLTPTEATMRQSQVLNVHFFAPLQRI
jgi:hypothetical protein